MGELAFSHIVTKTEAAVQMCSWEKVFWKYTAKLQENTHAKKRFQ